MRSLLPYIFALMAGCDCSGAVAEIGTGATAFEPIADGQELELIAGPQGGFHFIVNASMSGIEPGDPAMPGLLSNPETTFAIINEAGERIDANFPAYRLGYRERLDDPTKLQLPSGRILPLDDAVSPDGVYNQTVRLRLEISGDGGSASDEISVIAREGLSPIVDAGPDAQVIDAGL